MQNFIQSGKFNVLSQTQQKNGQKPLGLTGAKVSIIGLPAVGKTTLTKLIRGQQISGKYKPTMGFQLGAAGFNGASFRIWDFGGQKAFLKQHMAKYIHGSDIIFIVTDSTPKNVLTTKELLEYSQQLVEDCEVIAIANKQDLPGHMDAKRVEDVLRIPTYPLIAIDPANRAQMINLLSKALERIKIRSKSD